MLEKKIPKYIIGDTEIPSDSDEGNSDEENSDEEALKKIQMKKILVKKILAKKILMKKNKIFSTYINITKKLPDYRRNYYVAHKK